MDRLSGAARLTEDLVCPVGDHFVRIGIRRCPRAGLKDIDDEVLVELTFFDLLGCLLNRVGETGLEQPQLGVDECGYALDLRQGADEAARETQITDRKVLPGALGARPVVGAGGNLDLAHGVSFDARSLLGHRRHPSNRLPPSSDSSAREQSRNL